MPTKKALLVVDFDGKKIGSWQYKNEAEYKKAVKAGNYDTVKNVVLVDIEVKDGVLVVKPR
jgi:hypothetical protein